MLKGDIVTEAEWIASVAAYAAAHVERGLPIEEAVERGMADHTAALTRLAEGALDAELGYMTADAERWRAARDHVVAGIWAAVRS